LARDFLSVQDVVVKLESLKARHRVLEHEYHVYQKLSGVTGIPRVRWFGTEGGFDAMVLDCLGPSLEDYLARCRFKFTLQTVLLLADQLVCIFSLSITGFLSAVLALSPEAHSLS
jgi:casein kinase I family protein HRR25